MQGVASELNQYPEEIRDMPTIKSEVTSKTKIQTNTNTGTRYLPYKLQEAIIKNIQKIRLEDQIVQCNSDIMELGSCMHLNTSTLGYR